MATESQQAGQDASASFCNWHPETETRLHCSQCGRSICTVCLVQAPVGIRCRECSRAERLPTYDVQPTYMLRALGVAVAVALVGGVIWGVVELELGWIPFVSWLIAIGVGYGASELISLSVNRKRGAPLTWIAAGAVGGAGIIHLLFFLGSLGGFGLLVNLVDHWRGDVYCRFQATLTGPAQWPGRPWLQRRTPGNSGGLSVSKLLFRRVEFGDA